MNMSLIFTARRYVVGAFFLAMPLYGMESQRALEMTSNNQQEVTLSLPSMYDGGETKQSVNHRSGIAAPVSSPAQASSSYSPKVTIIPLSPDTQTAAIAESKQANTVSGCSPVNIIPLSPDTQTATITESEQLSTLQLNETSTGSALTTQQDTQEQQTSSNSSDSVDRSNSIAIQERMFREIEQEYDAEAVFLDSLFHIKFNNPYHAKLLQLNKELTGDLSAVNAYVGCTTVSAQELVIYTLLQQHPFLKNLAEVALQQEAAMAGDCKVAYVNDINSTSTIDNGSDEATVVERVVPTADEKLILQQLHDEASAYQEEYLKTGKAHGAFGKVARPSYIRHLPDPNRVKEAVDREMFLGQENS